MSYRDLSQKFYLQQTFILNSNNFVIIPKSVGAKCLQILRKNEGDETSSVEKIKMLYSP
jgi:hypothetical protein